MSAWKVRASSATWVPSVQTGAMSASSWAAHLSVSPLDFLSSLPLEELMRRPSLPVVVALACGFAVLARARAADTLDWAQEETSGLELLRDLVRMDTRGK